MKTLVLHIGTYKTGTTSIQNTLFRNSDTLIKQGINYLGYKNGCGRKNGRQVFHNSLDFESLVNYLRSENGNIHIYSNECLWDSKIVRNKLIPAIFHANIYSNFLVIGYVRKQSEFIESFYKQEQVFGKRWAVGLTPLEFWKGLDKKGTLDVDGTLSYFAKTFGQKNMIVKKYSRSLFESGDIIDDFFRHDIFSNIDIDKPKNLNTSVSPNEAILRSLAYSLLKQSEKNSDISKNKKIVDSFINKELSRFSKNLNSEIYSKEDKLMIDNYYLKGNLRVNLDYGVSLL